MQMERPHSHEAGCYILNRVFAVAEPACLCTYSRRILSAATKLPKTAQPNPTLPRWNRLISLDCVVCIEEWKKKRGSHILKNYCKRHIRKLSLYSSLQGIPSTSGWIHLCQKLHMKKFKAPFVITLTRTSLAHSKNHFSALKNPKDQKTPPKPKQTPTKIKKSNKIK